MIKRKRLRTISTVLVAFVFLPLSGFASDWPEFRGPGGLGIWNEPDAVPGLPDGEGLLPRVWSAPVGAGYSGPTVAGDGVYVLDRGATGSNEEVERIVCLDRATGDVKWIHTYACRYIDIQYAYGPRSSVTMRDGKAYALGAMGHLHCLDASTGKVHWAKDLGSVYAIDMPIWGLAASPVVAGDAVIVQAGAKEDGACILAFDIATGEEKWRAFADKASYTTPMLLNREDNTILVAWTGERIAGMDPATGAVHWEIATPPNRMPINVPGPAVSEDGRHLFLAVFYDGSRLIELSDDGLQAKQLWHRQGINERTTDALHCMISPPFFFGDHIYGFDSYGQMRCLEPTTGDRIWENQEAVPYGRWGTVFSVRNGDHIWMLNERGELIIATVSPEGYSEVDRAKLIEPTTELRQRPEGTVLWSHPAFAGTRVYARNDRELVCVELGE